GGLVYKRKIDSAPSPLHLVDCEPRTDYYATSSPPQSSFPSPIPPSSPSHSCPRNRPSCLSNRECAGRRNSHCRWFPPSKSI
ncbi:hypothetical protein PFISCL1PPCAC_18885, partial [Pristionchus fissidentatus]